MKKLNHYGSLIEVIQAFSNEERCIEYLKQLRWSGNPICPTCNCDKIYEFKDKKRYQCSTCTKQFNVKVGTIFENTKIKLSKWFTAIYLLTAHKKGISSLQLSRDLNVTQKTAWFMLQRIREMLKIKELPIIETIAEIDEVYIGGKEKNKLKKKKKLHISGRSIESKTPILGIMERGKGVRAFKMQTVSDTVIQSFIFKHISSTARIMTDGWRAYRKLSTRYDHSIINHNQGEYVRGDVHTNTIEGFWSLLKRGIIGIYHYASKKHLQKYVDEFVFRYNTHTMNDCSRFYKAIEQMNGRLKYKDLIANKNY